MVAIGDPSGVGSSEGWSGWMSKVTSFLPCLMSGLGQLEQVTAGQASLAI